MKKTKKLFKMVFITRYEYNDGKKQEWVKELWYTRAVSEAQAINQTKFNLKKQGIYTGIKDIYDGCVRKWIEAKEVEAKEVEA